MLWKSGAITSILCAKCLVLFLPVGKTLLSYRHSGLMGVRYAFSFIEEALNLGGLNM